LKNYIDEVYIFPEDDFITKKAIASSPELLYMRSKLYNKIGDTSKKIIIVHLNSFIRKLPSKANFINNKLIIKKGKKIQRDELIKKLDSIGYNRESMVYDTSEYAVRGFVIDVFPISEEKPIRIEFFDDEIEKIKYFDPQKQITCESIDNIKIGVIKDDYDDLSSSILDYVDNNRVIYTNYNQIVEQEKMILPQIKYLNIDNEIFKLKELKNDSDIYLDTINNKNCDLVIDAKSIDKYENNKEKFVNDLEKFKGIL
jgi:transcription-repair coupling factor (superfamily II helicase)